MAQYQKPATSQELRRRVLTLIDKLSDRSTLPQASSDLHYIAKTLPFDSLPTFVSCILSVDTSSKSTVRVHCINLLSLLAGTHTSCLTPHIPKILPFILRRLRDGDSAVRAAAVAAVTCLSPLNFKALWDHLIGSIFIEQDFNAQVGSTMCLKAAVDAAAEVLDGGDVAELRRVLPKKVKLVRCEGFKAKGALLGLIGSVVGVNDGSVISGRGGGFVGNVVSCAVEMLSCEDWTARKAAAEVLETVAVVAERELAMEIKGFCVSSLESRRYDKVKVTRETMNRALDAWKQVPGGPADHLPLTGSNSSISKDNGNGGLSRRSSYGGSEPPKPKKTITKSRSSLSEGEAAIPSSSTSTITQHTVGLETRQRRKTICKSRSSLSDDSTITDSSSVSKSSHDFGFGTPQSKSRSSLPDDLAVKKRSPSRGNDMKLSTPQRIESQKSLDWKVEIAVPTTKVVSDDNMETVEVSSLKFGGSRCGSHVVPLVKEDDSRGLVVEGSANEVGESDAEFEDMFLIRNQLLQIEKQQSNLLDLLQRFMGNSQSGINSLETRVCGLERALDEISYDLAVQSGRIPNNNDTAGSTCCPSTDFLSTKFWRRTEGRSSMSKPSYCGRVPPLNGRHHASTNDGNGEALQMDGQWHHQDEVISRDSWASVELKATKSVKVSGPSGQRGRTCSPRSFDAASTATCMTPVVRGT